MIGEPPSDAGAVQDTVASPSPATAVTLVGAPGTVAGITELLAEDAALVPALLVAVTVKVYAVPFVRPVTSHVRYVARRIRGKDAIDVFADLMESHGVPKHIRSDNGPEMVAGKLRSWLARLGTKTIYITLGSPWENSYCESFNGKLRDELLNGELFYTLREAQVLLEQWWVFYNTERPHSSLEYRPPAPETILPMQREVA